MENFKKYSIHISAAILFAFLFLFIGCLVGCQNESDEPLNLEGTWKQTNSSSTDSYHQAEINGDTITINWVSDSGQTKSLYWAGSYTPPTDNSKEYTWESINDKSKTKTALLAASGDTKSFTYSKGKISYEASAMGTTKTIELERAN